MKKFILGIVYALIALVVVFMGGAYVLPGEAVVERQITIAAPPDKVFAIVGDLKRFKEFSPWAEIDPGLHYSFEGPETGIGQKMSWTSDNPQLGSGSQTVVDYQPNKRFATTLDFGGRGSAIAYLDFVPVANDTRVTWGLKTLLRNPLERWMGLLYDRTFGPDNAEGLAKLKALAEK
ncbi:SRPBCC family protein [Nordella sp. HKS 07]|uniref:SRPBCC family protein n=1 Tax=Nordella sp. HKS 07 TaxID=2712222 RepID=UPI0013E15B8D|nr:SRPBCC family protein [Nordella sp. HKS 07]QIG51674.1 SRPBCC family protein [Nordella sp. HKS 07]